MATLRMADPWRDPRTGIWKLRKRIPQRYRTVADQRGDTIKLTTGTADRKEAIRRWPDVLRQWAEMEAEWERRLNCVALTPAGASEVAAKWAAWIAAGAKLEMSGETSDAFEPLSLPEERTPERMARMWDRVEAHAEEALRLVGLSITAESRPVLLNAMAPIVAAAYLGADLVSLGVSGSSPALRPLHAARAALPAVADAHPHRMAPAAVPLGSVFGTWQKTASVKPNTAAEAKYAVNALIEFLGHDDATRLTREDMIRWRDSMKDAGRGNSTWNNRLSLIRQIILRAVSDGKLATDSTDRLRLPKNAAKSWLPYTDRDAACILNAARAEAAPSRRWAHWIMAFTGMRVSEALQLSVRDLRQDNGIHYFAVHADDPDKTIKNGQRRSVPMHPALIAEGLLDYAATLPPDGPLFPDKRLDKFGRRGGRGWNAVGKWVRETAGIGDPRKGPDHSWRHRMEDELRNAEVPEDVRDAVVGHSRKTVGRVYGVRGEALRRLADAVDRLKLPAGVESVRLPPEVAIGGMNAPGERPQLEQNPLGTDGPERIADVSAVQPA